LNTGNTPSLVDSLTNSFCKSGIARCKTGDGVSLNDILLLLCRSDSDVSMTMHDEHDTDDESKIAKSAGRPPADTPTRVIGVAKEVQNVNATKCHTIDGAIIHRTDVERCLQGTDIIKRPPSSVYMLSVINRNTMGSFSRLRRKKRSLATFSVVCFFAYLGGGFATAFSPSIRPSTKFPPIEISTTRSVGFDKYRRHFTERSQQRHTGSKELLPLHARQWEGDDIRFIPKIRRRFSAYSRTLTPAKTALVFLNVAFFFYQVVNSVNYLRRKHPAYWPGQALEMIGDVLLGTSILGPFTVDFVHQRTLSRWQPHRYLTAGFLHGSLMHLLVNVNSLRQAPSWLETGLGWPVFVTTFLVGIVSGNAWHSLSTLDNSMCLGASGGICSLYGLMFVALIKMGNSKQGTRVLKSMGVLLLFGFVFPNISNAAHIGGFLGGIAMGILCCPSYRKSYSLSRKNSLEVDFADREYRLAMGFGKVPTRRGLVPLSLLWGLAIIALVSNPLYRRIPLNIYRGILQPGIHSN